MIEKNKFFVKLVSNFSALFCAGLIVSSCSPQNDKPPMDIEGSPYLFVFAGDKDEKDEDFLVVLDIDPKSDTLGKPVSSLPIGHKMSMPHHMEYHRPPNGEPIFMNAHHHELSMIVDVSDVKNLKIKNSFRPPAPYRFPHDYTRTPAGTRLVGFLRSEGKSLLPGDDNDPGNHGGIAEYTVDGELIRTASAAVEGLEKPVRPYAFALSLETDRLVVTSAPMMENSWADVVQIYRYSDFKLLHTMELPAGKIDGKEVPGSQIAGFGARVLDDGSVFLNTYGCSLYHLTDLASDTPSLKVVHTIETRPLKGRKSIRGACGIPYRLGQYWVQPVGCENMVVVLDISDPSQPKEVHRLITPEDFQPHWLAKDPIGNRMILGSEMGFEEGFFVLNFDEKTGKLTYDTNFQAKRGSGWKSWFTSKTPGYVSMNLDDWPHGNTGEAWGHAALFLSDENEGK